MVEKSENKIQNFYESVRGGIFEGVQSITSKEVMDSLTSKYEKIIKEGKIDDKAISKDRAGEIYQRFLNEAISRMDLNTQRSILEALHKRAGAKDMQSAYEFYSKQAAEGNITSDFRSRMSDFITAAEKSGLKDNALFNSMNAKEQSA